ncbi:Uncharacterised protein [Yersinia nurmii]|uniref:Uncharacterized protein n=1 Tax=Yersinia nurmii TaxID=685706 RepID=A0ABP1YEL7_9GAMM|nr:Uncharacterised protein [Yersinia nurmii]
MTIRCISGIFYLYDNDVDDFLVVFIVKREIMSLYIKPLIL